jgi:hypothetical protein
MTEEAWLNSRDPLEMIEFVAEMVSTRKLRLFACACCRQMLQHLGDWQRDVGWLLPDLESPKVFELFDSYADGRASESELRRAIQAAQRAFAVAYRNSGIGGAIEEDGANACRYAGQGDALLTADNAAEVMKNAESAERPGEERRKAAETKQAILLRDIVGNPIRPTQFHPQWRTATVSTLARQMYESYDFGAMPILADALEDADCDAPAILNHCRSPGPHVRGCWVVDLILDKQ